MFRASSKTQAVVAVFAMATSGACKKDEPKAESVPEEGNAEAKTPAPELAAEEVEQPEGPAGAVRDAQADVKNAEGKILGTAQFEQVDEGVKLTFEGSEIPPGKHGFHIHENGECEPPDFKSAGGHFAPRGQQHGLEAPKGHHMGDMPNLEVGKDGQVEFEYVLEGATLADDGGDESLRRKGGTALVLHAGTDDQKTDPAGDAGPRLGCGVIEIAGEGEAGKAAPGEPTPE